MPRTLRRHHSHRVDTFGFADSATAGDALVAAPLVESASQHRDRLLVRHGEMRDVIDVGQAAVPTRRQMRRPSIY
ncbi:Conserved hypothetical protein [Micromonospora lupini str. Lupac 08]|uniref:Uncharacterized protein n=1 Tax=Micromonospora lupini str. Lupac 08 TaxID=1150864 RepID=I0L7I7_9ACTN|nr:Conserved hypothetical protein [Micromonospora lupini str. Lupac 08]